MGVGCVFPAHKSDVPPAQENVLFEVNDVCTVKLLPATELGKVITIVAFTLTFWYVPLARLIVTLPPGEVDKVSV